MRTQKNQSLLSLLFVITTIVACADHEAAQKPKGDPILEGGQASARVQACSGYFYNSYYGTQYYLYPVSTVNITPGSTTISAYCTAYDVPNRFTLRNGAGNNVASSGWIGYANYPGPWGSSLSNGSNITISAPVNGSSTFTLEVETVPGGGLNDAWAASVGCN
ncbi:hypothetical protein [Pseudochryseolinea flava]|uniref:Uncharacterized protein n=1 Tax=Pseudochryseolinea flava TaxID=2059302 RepID=A0A364XY76_9BACT|nr:hypothetical protein [Pseudochryseolinea flava]RAV98520.1 hypothetical protein DQQ10_23665 [Pseudochryseolinea flava]